MVILSRSDTEPLLSPPDIVKSVGFALEEFAIASLAYDRAAAAGVGTRATF